MAMAALPLAALASACAKQEAPRGARPDTEPPRVESITPGRDTVVPGFDGNARIRFNEPVRVGADLERALVASPAFRYQVRTGFSDIRIRPFDGWLDGVVYCFELPAGISDLLGNRTTAPVGFCFSTGPPVVGTEVTGRITDRVTGQAVSDARVIFYRADGDTVPYTAVADREGDFRLQALPPDSYRAYAFIDRNRNLRLDRRLEPYDSVSFALDSPTATASMEFSLVEPDTTPPVLGAAQPVDSLTIRLEFDDYLPREQPDARVAVTHSETGRPWPVAFHTVGEPREDATLPTEDEPGEDEPGEDEPGEDEPGEDEPTEDEPTAHEAMEAVEPVEAAETTAEGDPAAGRAGPELPSRQVTVRLREPLEAGEFRVEAVGFLNLRKLSGGGDTTFVYTPPDPEADPEGRPEADPEPAVGQRSPGR